METKHWTNKRTKRREGKKIGNDAKRSKWNWKHQQLFDRGNGVVVSFMRDNSIDIHTHSCTGSSQSSIWMSEQSYSHVYTDAWTRTITTTMAKAAELYKLRLKRNQRQNGRYYRLDRSGILFRHSFFFFFFTFIMWLCLDFTSIHIAFVPHARGNVAFLIRSFNVYISIAQVFVCTYEYIVSVLAHCSIYKW